MEPVQRIFSAVVGGEVDIAEARNPQAFVSANTPWRAGRDKWGDVEMVKGSATASGGTDAGGAVDMARAVNEELASEVDP